LPQLINVLKGDMSLVGPRPEVPEYTADYTDHQNRVFLAKPGITGPSINVYEEELLARQSDKDAFYLNTILPQKLEVDIAYAENFNLFGDLKLLVSTFPKIFIRLHHLSRSKAGPARKNALHDSAQS
jgi:lipopolysaccharide/colanic/teichoic acid biosynthesis glycosyltransferase